MITLSHTLERVYQLTNKPLSFGYSPRQAGAVTLFVLLGRRFYCVLLKWNDFLCLSYSGTDTELMHWLYHYSLKQSRLANA